MPSQENDNRLCKFKNKGKDSEAMRRRRNEVTIELRKAKKDDQLLKRRNIAEVEEPVSPLQENNAKPPMSLEEIAEGMVSGDESVQVIATQAARKILSKEKSPPIDLFISYGLVPRCIEFLSKHTCPLLQFEAAWALTNVASGSSKQTMTVVEGGAIPKMVALLNSPYAHVAEQAVWAIGNIAGDGASTRDLVLEYNAMAGILSLVKPDTTISVLRNIAWCLSNLCRNKNPPVDFEKVRVCLPYLCSFLQYGDTDLSTDSCWALSYLTDGPNDKIQAVIDTGIVNKLVELLSSSELTVLVPALRTVGNIVTGSDAQTDSIINAGGLSQLHHLLVHPKSNIVKEAAWTLSNITAGNVHQIEHVIRGGLVKPLISVMLEGDFRSQKEAAWAITNYTSGGTVEQMAILVQEGAIPALCHLLESRDWKIVTVVLDGLANILRAAEKMDQAERVAIMIEECGGIDKLEELQHHENEQIYQKSSMIIEEFLSGEDAVDSTGQNEVNGQFGFNADAGIPDGGFSFQ